ncbi:MAG: hypothetical protein IJO55_04895 [Lachnospiraceae bacterium]|nr:hypothetical protein [Lachnospiraceae bacterium]
MKRTKQPSPAGIEIKMVMFRQNITVKELAQKIQKSEATVCEVISGKNRSEKTRKLILKALDIATDASWDVDE